MCKSGDGMSRTLPSGGLRTDGSGARPGPPCPTRPDPTRPDPTRPDPARPVAPPADPAVPGVSPTPGRERSAARRPP
ncbi:hypothetical protein GCM10010515_26560 [Streptomyces fructofermentans]|uniref:Uncharacterized protein n=1 Tax=Streptomyces fructofermentans TaxID=152141 RepID=A0A918KCL8_9ACTN|nr:hypothetical protein GCM10010515_26560 [Streptomyces fructofermentans]